jgi:predicted phosphodiesterase
MMLRIACVADTHGWDPPNIGPADLWLHAGDIKDRGGSFPLEPWIRLNMRLVHGNHDCGKMPPSLSFIDGDVVEGVKNLWIAGLGWNGGQFYDIPTHKEIEPVCSKIQSRLFNLKAVGRIPPKASIVLLSHYPPSSVCAYPFGYQAIDNLIKEINFDLIVSGHMHELAGRTFGNIIFPGPDGKIMDFE